MPTIVFSTVELVEVSRHAAGLHIDGQHFVELLRREPSPALAAQIEAASTDGHSAHVSGRAIHFLVQDGYAGVTLLRKAVERELGVTTNRNARATRRCNAPSTRLGPRCDGA